MEDFWFCQDAIAQFLPGPPSQLRNPGHYTINKRRKTPKSTKKKANPLGELRTWGTTCQQILWVRCYWIFQPRISSRLRQNTLQEKPTLLSWRMQKGLDGGAGRMTDRLWVCRQGSRQSATGSVDAQQDSRHHLGQEASPSHRQPGILQRCGLSWNPASAWSSRGALGYKSHHRLVPLCQSVSSHGHAQGESTTSDIPWEGNSHWSRTNPSSEVTWCQPTLTAAKRWMYRPGKGIRLG